MTEEELKKSIRELQFQATAEKSADFVIWTGSAGMKEFEKAIREYQDGFGAEEFFFPMSKEEKEEYIKELVAEAFPNVNLDETI